MHKKKPFKKFSYETKKFSPLDTSVVFVFAHQFVAKETRMYTTKMKKAIHAHQFSSYLAQHSFFVFVHLHIDLFGHP